MQNKIERIYTHYEKNAAGVYAPAATTVYAVRLDGAELIFEKAGRVRRVPVEDDGGFFFIVIDKVFDYMTVKEA